MSTFCAKSMLPFQAGHFYMDLLLLTGIAPCFYDNITFFTTWQFVRLVIFLNSVVYSVIELVNFYDYERTLKRLVDGRVGRL